MEFDFSENKNEILYKVRGVSFYQIIEAISEHGILLNIKHPNEDKYPNQWMMVVKMNNYTYSVPYVLNEEKIYLKTIYPNRKFLHLLSNEEKKMKNKYIDDEEKKIIESFNTIDYSRVTPPTSDEQEKFKEAASKFIKKETKMNIRIDPIELKKLKEIADSEGLKYQTFVKSIIHKYITGQLVEKRKIS